MKTIPVILTGTCFGSIGDDGKYHKRRKSTIVKAIQWFVESEGFHKIINIHEIKPYRKAKYDEYKILVDVE